MVEQPTYILLVENCVNLIAKLIAIATMSRLVLCVKFWPNSVQLSDLSVSMQTYLGAHIIGSIIGLPSVFVLV